MSAAPSSSHAYDRAQRGFHWVMAAIILLAIGLGVWARMLTPGEGIRPALLDVHKSLGLTALVLVAFRLLYRLWRGEPSYREPPDRVVHGAAGLAHWALYALMIFMPVTGYTFSAAGGHSLPWFGLFQAPNLMPRDEALEHLGQRLHYLGAWTIGALLCLHIAAVLWHVAFRRDEVLSRMAPSFSAGRGGAS